MRRDDVTASDQASAATELSASAEVRAAMLGQRSRSLKAQGCGDTDSQKQQFATRRRGKNEARHVVHLPAAFTVAARIAPTVLQCNALLNSMQHEKVGKAGNFGGFPAKENVSTTPSAFDELKIVGKSIGEGI